MKKINIKKLIAKKVVKSAEKTSELVANSACIWWDYQAEMPKSVRKMRKF